MNELKKLTQITTHRAINGLEFGRTPEHLIERIGPPEQALENYTGELEMRFDDRFYRFFEDRFVEATCPANHHFVIDGRTISDVFTWLNTQDDVIDKARFRISLAQGMAFDYRNPEAGSLTVFESGRWDNLVLGYQ